MTLYAGHWGPEAMQDKYGNAAVGVVVAVLELDGTAATTYVDRDRMPGAPSISAGELSFFAEPGHYLLRTTYAGTVRMREVTVYADPDEPAGPGGGSGDVASVNGRTGAVVGLAEASALTAETAARAAADAALDVRLDVVEPLVSTAVQPDVLAAALAGLVGTAPAALNALGELADALGDDPNFAATMATQLGLKASTADLQAAVATLQASIAAAVDPTELAAAIAALSGTYSARLRPVATNLHLPTRNSAPNNLSSSGSGITTQIKHTVQTACAGLRLAYSNYYNNSGVDADGPNPITVKASIRLDDGSHVPVFFNGRRTIIVEPGQTVLSDPVGLAFTKGQTFLTRTYVSVYSGESYPLGLTTNATDGEGVVSGDSADSGSISASTTKGYSPWAILGAATAKPSSPSVLLLGDSRVVGYGDTSGTADSFGWVRRALDGNLPYLNLGVSGTTAAGADALSELRRRMALADLCTFDAAVVVFGVNDLTGGSTAAQVQARLTLLYGFLNARGLRVYGATVAPVTTSTDAWATTGNQTAVASNAERVLLNTWIRTTPAPLTGYFDLADAVETARNSGIWKAGHTADGTHENATGYAAEAAVVTPSTFGTLLAA